MNLRCAFVAALLIVTGGFTTAHGQLYWDLNGTTAGAGSATPAGTWDAITSNWNTDPTGGAGGALVPWDGSTAIFAAGTDATGSYTVTLDAIQSALGINFEEGNVTISGGTELDLTGGTIDVASGATGIVNSVLGGAVGLNKTGSGTLTLGGANLYSGVTSVTAGILKVTNATGLGAVDATNVASGASLEFTADSAEPLNLSGMGSTGTNGALFKSGSAAVNISGGIGLDADARINNNGTGTFTLSGGVAMLGGNLTVGGTGNTTISTVALSGAGALTKDGSGTLTLSGAHTYTGATTVNAGILAVSNATGLGTTAGTTIVNDGGTLQVSGGVTIAEKINLNGGGSTGSNGALRKTGNNTTAISGQLTGSGSIVVTAGVLRLSASAGGGDNAGFTGPITVNGGGTLRFEFTSPNQLGTGNTITLDNGTLDNINSNVPGNGSMINSSKTIVLGAGGGTLNYATVGGLSIVNTTSTISGTGGLTKTGAGAIAIASTCSYGGPTTVSAGILRVRGASERFPDATALTVATGATFDVDGFTETVGSVAGEGTVEIDGGTLIAGGNNSSTTFSGTFTGAAGKFTKQGTGTLTLSGNNLHGGLTTISAGAVAVQHNGALGTTAGSTTVSSGAQLQLDGTGLDIADALLINGTGLSNNGALRNLANDNTASGAITLNAATRIQSDAGTLTVSGTIKSSSTTTRNLTIGGAGHTTLSNVVGDPAATNNIGTLTKSDGGTLTLSAPTGNVYTGATSITAGKLLAVNTSGSATGAGAVTVSGTGTLGGTGFISGAVTVNSGGHVAPGNSIESLDVGSLTLNTGSVLDIELGTNGVSDLINVTTADGLNLAGGSVALSAANLGDLAVGNVYTLIDYAGTLAGSVANLGTPTGPSGFSYSLFNNTSSTTIELHVAAAVVGVPGDYNGNGIVDGADYVVWRKNKGATGSPTVSQGNGDGDGDVDDDDYTYWRTRYGNTSGSGSGGGLQANAAVPEPAGLVLLTIAGTLSALRRRRRER